MSDLEASPMLDEAVPEDRAVLAAVEVDRITRGIRDRAERAHRAADVAAPADDDTAAFDALTAGIIAAARASGPGGLPRWKLRAAVVPEGAPSGPFFLALIAALESGDLERVPGDVPGSRYRARQRDERPSGLPTPAEMIANADELLLTAYRALGDAGDELRSDWRPGTSLTTEQAGQRARMQQAISKAKAAINEGRR